MKILMLKLIESLRHCTASEGDCRSCPHYTHDSGCLDRLHIEAADFLESQQKRIAELEEKSRWVPVTERLPEYGEIVLALGKRHATSGQFRGTGSDPSWWHWKGNTLKEVGHWMPLPEPPKEVE